MPPILVYALSGILAFAVACLLFGLGVYGLVWSVRWAVRAIVNRRAERPAQIEPPRPMPLGSTESVTMSL